MLLSRMTKFLKQTCSFESAQREDNLVVLNEYGDIQYNQPITKACRREAYVRDLQTANGAILKTSSRYFLDESTVIRANDRIDGCVILACSEYTNQFGQCEGYEIYV